MPSKDSQIPIKRKSERLAMVLPVLIQVAAHRDAGPEQTYTQDLSRSGISFQSGRNYRPGTKVGITFEQASERQGSPQAIPAQVVRVSRIAREKKFVIGAHFTETALAAEELVELLRVQMRTSQALLQIMNALSPKAGVRETAKRISTAAAQTIGAEEVHLFISRNALDSFTALIGSGRQKLEIKHNAGFLGYAASCGKLTNIQSPSQHPLFSPELDQPIDSKTGSVLCIPFQRGKGATSGLLVALNKRHGLFTREDEMLGMAIANQISVVLRETDLIESNRTMKNLNDQILESMATGIVTFDKFGKLTSVNRAGTRIFGFNAHKDSGKDIAGLLGRSDNARLCSLVEAGLTSRRRQTAYDVRLLRPDQGAYSLNLTAVPLKDTRGLFIGEVLVAEDITKEQRFMNALCRYLAREVAEQVVKEEGIGKLGGTRSEVTILIADIRNFTRISEEMDATDLMDLLNTYFPRMINVLFRHHGMVDKFMGDAILAVFGVPIMREDDSLRAVRAAIEMQEELAVINRNLARSQGMALEIGIGITSGTVIAGNLGSERRMDFTVIGDPVNLAARLEGLTKDVKQKILMSDKVYKAVNKAIPCHPLGPFNVKGKREKVNVFAVQTKQSRNAAADD